jgi:hypothetical protein
MKESGLLDPASQGASKHTATSVDRPLLSTEPEKQIWVLLFFFFLILPCTAPTKHELNL